MLVEVTVNGIVIYDSAAATKFKPNTGPVLASNLLTAKVELKPNPGHFEVKMLSSQELQAKSCQSHSEEITCCIEIKVLRKITCCIEIKVLRKITCCIEIKVLTKITCCIEIKVLTKITCCIEIKVLTKITCCIEIKVLTKITCCIAETLN
ncbi:hypothetical protein DPMN_189044 [Dreissena polymorpha]|uniref:Uncharacterized protein n=1 Tax=Dreissena polymorpha TaxID=45954 RepID=A0A9D4I942_DREPO|nr:hypothetical protein DPMN_189044 [Dreissena polymorpha]